MRQRYLSSLRSNKFRQQYSFVSSKELPTPGSGFTCLYLKTLPPHGCDYCNKDTVYSSLSGALCHLHRYHIHCIPVDRPILNGPFVGWVKWQPLSFDPKDKIMSVASRLIDTLTEVRERTKRLTCLPVAKKHASPEASYLAMNLSPRKKLSAMNCGRVKNLKRSNGYQLRQGVALCVRAHNVESKLKCQLEDARRDVMMAKETQTI